MICGFRDEREYNHHHQGGIRPETRRLLLDQAEAVFKQAKGLDRVGGTEYGSGQPRLRISRIIDQVGVELNQPELLPDHARAQITVSRPTEVDDYFCRINYDLEPGKVSDGVEISFWNRFYPTQDPSYGLSLLNRPEVTIERPLAHQPGEGLLEERAQALHRDLGRLLLQLTEAASTPA